MLGFSVLQVAARPSPVYAFKYNAAFARGHILVSLSHFGTLIEWRGFTYYAVQPTFIGWFHNH